MNIMSRFEKKHKLNQTAVVLIHGFTSQTTDTMTSLKEDLEALDYVVIRPILFDITNSEDLDYLDWIARAQIAAKQAVEEYGRVIVVGHSMGALIASYVAVAVEGIEKAVLLSGPFDMITLATAKQGLITLSSKLIAEEEAEAVKYALTDDHRNTLLDIYDALHYAPSKIKIPVLFIHGAKDGVVDVSASKAGYQMVQHENKQMLIIHDHNHDINEINPGRNLTVNAIHGFINNMKND